MIADDLFGKPRGAGGADLDVLLELPFLEEARISVPTRFKDKLGEINTELATRWPKAKNNR